MPEYRITSKKLLQCLDNIDYDNNPEKNTEIIKKVLKGKKEYENQGFYEAK